MLPTVSSDWFKAWSPIPNKFNAVDLSSNDKDYGKEDDRFIEIQADMDTNNIKFKRKITELYTIVK